MILTPMTNEYYVRYIEAMHNVTLTYENMEALDYSYVELYNNTAPIDRKSNTDKVFRSLLVWFEGLPDAIQVDRALQIEYYNWAVERNGSLEIPKGLEDNPYIINRIQKIKEKKK